MDRYDFIYDLTDRELDLLIDRLNERMVRRNEEEGERFREFASRNHCKKCGFYMTVKERKTGCDYCFMDKKIKEGKK